MDDPSTYFTPLRMSRPFSPGAAGGGSFLRSDNFNGAAGALLVPSDGGSSWVKPAGTWTTDGAQANEGGSADPGVCYLESGVANVSIVLTLNGTMATWRCGIIGRCNGTADHLNGVVVYSGGTIMELVNQAGGGWSVLGSWSGTVSPGDKIRMDCLGDNLSAWHFTAGSWTQRISAVDATYNTQTKHGMCSSLLAAQKFDDFQVTAL